MTTPTPPSLWRNRRYLLWLVSDTSKGLAAALFGFALPLLTLIVTNDPAQAGIIGAVGGVVRTLCTLYGGVLADRHSRITLMISGASIGLALSAGLTVLAATGSLDFAMLLAVTVLLAARGGLFDVAGESAIKEIVPDGAMGRAQAANQARAAVIQLAGGPLGGVLLAIGGWVIGAAMTLCHLISTVTAWLLRGGSAPSAPQSPASAPPVKSNALTEIREGFAWIFARPDLRGVLLISTIINLGFNAALTTAIFALQQRGESPAAIGWISAGAGAAMLAGALLAPTLVPRVRAGFLTIAGLAAASVGVLLLSQAQAVWAIVAVIAGSVFLLPALNAAVMGYFMVAVPTELLGRANSASMVLGIGAMPLGPLIAGFGLVWIGRDQTILACAGLCAVATILALTNRGLRSIPVEAGWASHAAQFAESRASR